jgi:opacity protein-like surface antigen
MLTFKQFYLMLMLCLFNMTAIFAQKSDIKQGYYLDTTDKRVDGFFDFDKLEENIVFFSPTNSEKGMKRIAPFGISKIVTDDTISIFIQKIEQNNVNEYLFLEPLLTGSVNFYRGFSSKKEEVFFINTIDNPKIRRINHIDPKSFLKIYFNGCEQVKKQLSSVRYDRASLRSAIKQFEDCYVKNGVSYNVQTVKKLTNSYFEIGGQVGFSFSRSNANLEKQSNFTGFPLGIQLRYNIRKNMFFTLGLRYSQLSLSGFDNDSVIIRSPGRYAAYFYVYKTEPSIKNSIVEFPFEFGYKFKPIKSFIPFLTFGANISKEVSSFKTLFKPDYYYFRPLPGAEGLPESWYLEGLPASPTFNPFDKNGERSYLNFSLFGGIGLRKELNTKWSLEGSLRYQNKFATLSDGANETISTNIQRVELNFNLLYRF